MATMRADWCALGAPVAFVIRRTHVPEMVRTLVSDGRAELANDVSLRHAFQLTESHFLAAEPQFCYEDERGGSLRFGYESTLGKQTFV